MISAIFRQISNCFSSGISSKFMNEYGFSKKSQLLFMKFSPQKFPFL